MQSLSAHDLLRVSEAGSGRPPLDRAVALLGAACPELTREELLQLSIGQRDARLLALRERTFGPKLGGFIECPSCSERLELEFTAAEIRAPEPEDAREIWEASVEQFAL